MEDREFSLKEVTEGLKIKRETFKEWILQGYVSASIKRKQGTRVFSSYTTEDVYAAALFKHLVENASLPREAARAMVHSWRRNARLDADFLVIANEGEGSYDVSFQSVDHEVREDGMVALSAWIPDTSETVFIVNFKKIVNQVQMAFDLK